MLSARSTGAPDCVPPALDPEHPTNALVLAPSMAAAGDDACAELLAPVEPAETDMLLVTTDQSPDERLAEWRSRSSDRLPARARIVGVGETTRSATASTSASGCTAPSLDGQRFYRTTVANPGDLTGLGARVSRALEAWDGDGNLPVVCVRSLTDLLHHADDRRVFRFLHTITGLVGTAGGVAHYHMDPNAHDEQTLATFRSLFDVVLAHCEDGWQRN